MNANPYILAALVIPTGYEDTQRVAALPTEGIDTSIVYVLTADDGEKAAGTLWKNVAGEWAEQTAVPVEYQHYDGGAKTYITFFVYAETETLAASGRVKRRTATGQIDIWTTGDKQPVYDAVRKHLRESGIKSPGGVPDASFDIINDEPWFHALVEFSISEDVDAEVASGYGS
jgi:hypothetical protein